MCRVSKEWYNEAKAKGRQYLGGDSLSQDLAGRSQQFVVYTFIFLKKKKNCITVCEEP